MPPRRKRYLDNTTPADNTSNVVRPVNRMIQVKQQDTPVRREKETREYQAKVQTGQRILNRFSRTPAGRRAANRAYAVESQRQQQEAAKEEAAAVVGSFFKPVMPSTYVDMAAAIKNGQVNNLTDALAAPYLTDSWSMRNPGKALVADIAAPFALGGASKIVKGAGIPLGNGTKWHLRLPINDNYYYRQGNNIIADAENTGVIAVKSKPSKDFVSSKGHVFNFGKKFDVPFFSKGSPWYGTNNKLETIVNTGKGNYDWMPITKGGRFRPTADRNSRFVMSRVTPLVNGEAGLARASDFIGFTPRKLGYTSRRLGTKPQWDTLLDKLGLNPSDAQIIETLQRAEPVPRDILRRPISGLSDKEKVQRSIASGVNDAVRFLRGKNYRNRLKAIGYTSDEADHIIENQVSNIKRADVETYPEGNSLLGRNGSATPYRNLAGEMHYQIAAQPNNSLGYNPRVTGMHEALHVGSNQHLVDDFTSLPSAIREHNASIRPIVNDDYDAARVFQRLTDEELRARALTTIAASERIGMPVMDYIDAFGFRGVGGDIRPMMNPNFNANAAELRDYFTRESLKNYLDKVAGVAMPLGVGYGVYKNQ